jgi:3-hydroxyisobutyrate dehydrogenase-like beta-hydroxyacid dehydrogenase
MGSHQAAASRRTLFERERILTDMRLCLEEGQALGVPFPTAVHTREVLAAATGLRHAGDDFAAMSEPLETAAGT